VTCGRATKPGARFCGGCGASLARRCPACGAQSEPDTRFCEACGASLPDAVIEPLYYVAVEEHGHLAVTRRFGTLVEGGGEFENVYVRLERYEGDRIVAAELFELDDLDLARARLEELRPNPVRIAPPGPRA
jgi:hypothetical protein